MLTAGPNLGGGKPAVVAPILRHDQAIVRTRNSENPVVRKAAQRAHIAHGNNVVAARLQPRCHGRVHHFVEEQLQARWSSRLRSHSASARSDSSSRTRIHSSISSW